MLHTMYAQRKTISIYADALQCGECCHSKIVAIEAKERTLFNANMLLLCVSSHCANTTKETTIWLPFFHR